MSAHRAIFLLGDRWWQFPNDLGVWWKFLMTLWWSLWQDTNMRLVQKHDINEETREFTLKIRVQLKCHVDMLYRIGWSWCLHNTQDGFSNPVGRFRFNELSLFFGRILEVMQQRLSAWWPRVCFMKMQDLLTSPRNSQVPCFSVSSCCWALGMVAPWLNMWSFTS